MGGLFREGVTSVIDANDCVHVPKLTNIIRGFVAEFLRDKNENKLPIWSKMGNNGVWRQLLVRQNRFDELLLVLQFAGMNTTAQTSTPLSNEALAESINDHFTRLIAHLIKRMDESGHSNVVWSLWGQANKVIANVAPDDSPLRLYHGPQYFQEKLLDCTFRIPPTGFFQVNTLAAEQLFRLIAKFADVGPDTILLDVCCGSGTIGLTLAGKVKVHPLYLYLSLFVVDIIEFWSRR